MPSWLNWIYTDLDIDSHLAGLMTVYLDTQYLFRLIWTTSINDHQCAVPCAACHFMLLHSRPASNPRLVDFQAYLYLAAKDAVAFSTNQAVPHTTSSRMPIWLQLGNFWSPVAVASRHFHVCGSWRREMY